VELRYANITTHYKSWDRETKEFELRNFTTNKVLQYFDVDTETWEDLDEVDIDVLGGKEITKEYLTNLIED